MRVLWLSYSSTNTQFNIYPLRISLNRNHMMSLTNVFDTRRRVFALIVIASSLVGLFSFFRLGEVWGEEVPLISDDLRLKAPEEAILYHRELPSGEVKYAYRSDSPIADRPSQSVVGRAQEKGVSVGSELVEKRTGNSRTFATNQQNVYVMESIPGSPQYYKDRNNHWWQIEHATTTKEAFEQQSGGGFSFLRTLFGSEAFAESTTFGENDITVDGRVRAQAVTFSAALTADPGDFASHTVTEHVVAQVSTDAGVAHYYIDRGFFLFDTSTISPSATVDSAAVELYIEDKKTAANDGYDYVSIVTTSPASTTALEVGDIDQMGSTEQHDTGQRKDITSVSTGQFTTWTLNSTGRGNITKGGITKFGAREGHDLTGNSPGLSDSQQVGLEIRYSEYTGTTYDPRLVVVYSIAPASINLEVRKSADQSESSTAGWVNDGGLRLTLASSTTYMIDGWIYASSTSATPDMKIGFRAPEGAEMDIGYIAANDTTFGATGLLLNSEDQSQQIDMAANSTALIHVGGTVVVGANAGDLQLLWKQSTSNATPVTVLEGSWLRANADDQ